MATFGYESAGGSSDGRGGDAVEVCKFSCNGNGTITQLSIYGWSYTDMSLCRGCIYSDNAGAPNTLLATGTEINVPNAVGWTNYPISLAVTNLTVYWIGLEHDAAFRYYYDAGDANQTASKSTGGYPNLPNPFGAPDESFAWKGSIHADYTPAAAGGAAGGFQGLARDLTLTLRKPFSQRFPLFKPRMVA